MFHVAAVADYWRADRARMMDVNVEGTRRVLQAARETGVQRVVFTSSAAAVGFRADRPADEADAFNLPPDRFPYGYSKALAEAVVAEAVQAGQEVVIVNPVVVMGPGDLNVISGDFVLKIKRLGWTVPVPPGGVAVIDVRDVARMQIAAAEQGQVGERYLLGTANYKYADWFGLIAEVVGASRAPTAAARVAAAAGRRPDRHGAAVRDRAAGRRQPDALRRAGHLLRLRQGVARTRRAADRHAPERSGYLPVVSRTWLRQT